MSRSAFEEDLSAARRIGRGLCRRAAAGQAGLFALIVEDDSERPLAAEEVTRQCAAQELELARWILPTDAPGGPTAWLAARARRGIPNLITLDDAADLRALAQDLNIRRDLLREGGVCAALLLSPRQMAALASLAPDFWRYLHEIAELKLSIRRLYLSWIGPSQGAAGAPQARRDPALAFLAAAGIDPAQGSGVWTPTPVMKADDAGARVRLHVYLPHVDPGPAEASGASERASADDHALEESHLVVALWGPGYAEDPRRQWELQRGMLADPDGGGAGSRARVAPVGWAQVMAEHPPAGVAHRQLLPDLAAAPPAEVWGAAAAAVLSLPAPRMGAPPHGSTP